MSVNRIGHLVAPQQLAPKHQQAAKILHTVLDQTPMMQELEQFRRKHPGQQPYLLVLDTTMQIVRDLIRHLPEIAERLATGEAAVRAQEGGTRPDVALWIQLVPRQAGIEVARFVAEDEPMVQARCDQWIGADAMAMCVAGGGMVMTDVCLLGPGERAAAERARRRDRDRRHGR
jgi:hypothetical protein